MVAMVETGKRTERGEKVKLNLCVPTELADEFERTMERYGPKEKWLGLSGAMVAWLRLTADERRAMIDQIAQSTLNRETLTDKLVPKPKGRT